MEIRDIGILSKRCVMEMTLDCSKLCQRIVFSHCESYHITKRTIIC